MNIVIASYGFLPSVGGVSTNVAVLARAFVDLGHNVTVVTLSPGPTAGYGHAVERNPGPLRLFWLYRTADLVILSNLAVKLIYPLLLLRRTVALRHHSESAFGLSSSWFSLDVIRRDVMSRARHFVTSAYIGGKSGLRHFVVTPPFANPLHLTPGISRPPSERSGALFVGRTEPEKGVLWIIDRWQAIKDTLGVDELRIVGKGSLDELLRSRMTEMPGIRHLGALDLGATAREMGRARYLLVPSLWEEPFGAVALEGVAAGALTILTRRGGLPEAAGSLGFYFDPENDATFLEALRSARSTFEGHLTESDRRDAWEADVLAHVDRFRPEINVRRILGAMASPDAPESESQ
jgi:glycosyltransferase involved in cell wall biosynthesis